MFNFDIDHINSVFEQPSSSIPPAHAVRTEFRVEGVLILEHFDWNSYYGEVVTPQRTYSTKMRGQLRVHTDQYRLATLAHNAEDSAPQLFFALNDHCLSFKSMFVGQNHSGIINRVEAIELASHFQRKNKPMFTVHGVAGQCHIWTRMDQLKDGVDVRNTNFLTFGAAPIFNFDMNHINSLFEQASSFIPPATAVRTEFRAGGELILEHFDWDSAYGQVVTPERTYVTKMRGQLRIHTNQFRLATLRQNADGHSPQLFFALNDHCLSFKGMFVGLDYSGILNRSDALELASYFPKKNKPVFTVHGVSGQCHIWTRLDQLQDGVDIRHTNFQTFGSIPQSMISGIGIQGFGQMNRNKWLAESTENGHRYKSGTILSPPDGFCVFHAILQITRFDEDQLTEFISMVRTMFNTPKGDCTVSQLGALMYNTGIQVIPQLALFKTLGGELSDSPRNYTLVYSQRHCFAWIPNGKSDKDKIDLAQINENFSIMLGKTTLSKVSFNYEKTETEPPKPCVVKTRKAQVVQEKPSLQPSEVTVEKKTKSTKIWIDPRKLFVSKLIVHVEQQLAETPFESMNEYNRDESKAWNDIYFFYQYERQYPASFPYISCKTSLRIATSISRHSFPNLYAQDKESHPMKFQEPIPASLGSRMEIVSKQALNTLGAQKIISLHQPRSTQIQGQVDQKKKMISGYRSVSAQPNGIIDRECLEVLAKYGIQVDTSMLKQNSACGGHAFLRYVVDLLQSNSLTRILKDTHDQLVVDVGAKFGSNYPILRSATRLQGEPISSRQDDSYYRIKYIKTVLANFITPDGFQGIYGDFFRQVSLVGYSASKSDEWMKSIKVDNLHPILRDCLINNLIAEDQRIIREEFKENMDEAEQQLARDEEIDDDLRSNHPLFNALKPLTYREIVLKFSRHILNLPILHYMPIRPVDTDYNRLYHSECSAKYREDSYKVSYPGQCMALDIGVGTIQDYEEVIVRNKRDLVVQSDKMNYFRRLSDMDLLALFSQEVGGFDVGAFQLLTRLDHSLVSKSPTTPLFTNEELRIIAQSEDSLFDRISSTQGWIYEEQTCQIPANFPAEFLEICGSIMHAGSPCSTCPAYLNRLNQITNANLAFMLSQFSYGDRDTYVKRGSPVPPLLQILRNLDVFTLGARNLDLVSYSGSENIRSETLLNRCLNAIQRYGGMDRVGGMDYMPLRQVLIAESGERSYKYTYPPAFLQSRAFPQYRTNVDYEMTPLPIRVILAAAFEALNPRAGHFMHVPLVLNGEDDVQISLFMNDVHYYLADYSPSFNCLMYITGCDFYPFPGFYTLPCGEGSVAITSRADYSGQVCMQTQGSGIPYDHDLVRVRDHTFRIDYGWFSHFQKIHNHKNGGESIISKIYVPRVKILKSIQQSFVLQSFNMWGILEKTNIATLTPIQEEARLKCYRFEDVEQILREGFLQAPTANTSFLKRVSKFLLNRVQTTAHVKVNSFVNAMNYSTMLRISDYSELRLLGGLFTQSYERSYGLYPEFNDDNIGTFFHRRQVNVQEVEMKAQILLAGRSDHVRSLAHSRHCADLDQLSVRDQCFLFQQSKPAKTKSADLMLPSISQEKSDYFYVKPVPVMPAQNIETIPDNQSFQRLSRNYNSWRDIHGSSAESHSKKGFTIFDSQCVKKKCGYDVISNGQVVQSFEWGSKAIQNAASAFVGRQINSLTIVDLEELKIFQRISNAYIDKMMMHFQKDEQFQRDLRTFDPIRWIADKSSFDEGKKQKYFRTIVKQQQSNNPAFIGSFKTMVKSGEVQFSESKLDVESGFLIDQDSRPRNISIPCATSCGFLTAVQSTIFPAIQRYDPSFVQACTKEQLTARYRDALIEIQPQKSISLDGSSFDSTQYKLLQQCVDVYFWKQIEQLFEQHLCRESDFKMAFRDIFIQNLIRDACLTDHQLFVSLPSVTEYEWTDEEMKIFRRDWPNEDLSGIRHRYIPIKISGTTFSGHPTATTLGNTLRSICYVLYYAFKAQISVSDLRFFAAGDDVNVFVRSGLENRLMASILNHTNRSNTPRPGTLGQIIKDIRISHWSDVDFCSKWSFSDGTYDSFYFTRDCKKTLATRLFYTGSVKEFLNDPNLYISALLEGFRSEHLSRLIEDIFSARLTSDFVAGQSVKLSHEYENCGNYSFESSINNKLGLTLATLLDVISHNTLQLLAGREDREFSHTKINNNQNFCDLLLPSISEMENQLTNINKQMKELYKKRQQLYKTDPAAKKKVRSGLEDYARIAKERLAIPKKSYDEVVHAMENKNDPLHSRIISLVNHLQSRSPSSLLKAIGVKIAKEADADFAQLSVQQQRTILAEILVDDWAPVIKSISTSALPHIWNMAKNSSYGKKALSILRDYLGLDLNDDSNTVLGPFFSRNASTAKTVDWADFSSGYAGEISAFDGVNTQALASILMPELSKCRVPSDTAIRCGLVNKSYSLTLPTNSSGNAGFVLRPQLVTGNNWIQFFNDSSFNSQTWAQSVVGGTVAGPLASLSTVTGFRVTSTCIEIQPIVSQLNNQGQLTTCMNDDESPAISGVQMPVSSTTVRDSQYVTYGNISGSSGHRLAYHNDSASESQFYQYNASNLDNDYIAIVITGGAVSSNVLQLTITYQVEFTTVGNVLVDMLPTPPGPATLKCLSSALSINPHLRLLGHQECVQLYTQLISTPARYQDVLETLTTQKFHHRGRQVLTSTGQNNSNNMQAMSCDLSSMSESSILP